MKPKKEIRKGNLTAKLVFFDWGWADNIIYKIKGQVNEKHKGLEMIAKIKEFFGIQNNDIDYSEKKKIKDEVQRIKWTRNSEGRIISPFDKKIEKSESKSFITEFGKGD